MPPCPPDGLLLRGLYLSLDPYMRGRMDDRKSYARPVAIGEVMAGETVSEVLESNHPAYAVGDIVLARTGWTTHATSDGAGLRKVDPTIAPITTGLGVHYEFAEEHYPAFLKTVSQGLSDGASSTARTSTTASKMRAKPSSACCAAKTSAKSSYA